GLAPEALRRILRGRLLIDRRRLRFFSKEARAETRDVPAFAESPRKRGTRDVRGSAGAGVSRCALNRCARARDRPESTNPIPGRPPCGEAPGVREGPGC